MKLKSVNIRLTQLIMVILLCHLLGRYEFVTFSTSPLTTVLEFFVSSCGGLEGVPLSAAAIFQFMRGIITQCFHTSYLNCKKKHVNIYSSCYRSSKIKQIFGQCPNLDLFWIFSAEISKISIVDLREALISS